MVCELPSPRALAARLDVGRPARPGRAQPTHGPGRRLRRVTEDPGSSPQTWPSSPVPWSTTANPSGQPWPSGNQPIRSPEPIPAPERRPISPALPIVFTLLWLLVMAASGWVGIFSIFLFDAGVDRVSVWTWLIFFGIWGTVLLCPTSVLFSWIVWIVTRRRMPTGWGRIIRGVCYALPAFGIMASVIGFLAGELLCAGSLTCD